MKLVVERMGAALALAASPAFAFAQHGMDFLIVPTPLLPEAGQAYVYVRHDYVSQFRSETRAEPGLLFGLSDWATLEIEGRFMKPQRRSIAYESSSAALHLGFTPRGDALSFGVSARYEVAHGGRRDERWIGTLSAAYEAGRLLSSLNIAYRDAAERSQAWSFAAGARVALTARHGAGLELHGALHRDGATEAVLGYYGALSPRFTVNAGLGAGIDQGPDWTARTAFIFRFR